MKTGTYTNIDNKVININNAINSCEVCNKTFPLCMIENTDICCNRINEIMENMFRD